MINIKKATDCYGCYACANICPKNCITMAEDNEGFRYPVTDIEKCMDCGTCNSVCPKGSYAELTNRAFQPEAYAGYAIDEKIREGSATGGLFHTLAKYICEFRGGGYTFGVTGSCMTEVAHRMAASEEEVAPMCNSKYLQSKVGFAYRETKKALEEQKPVLFSGTPCQIAGLLKYLGKPYPNLYTVDLICHGVPSARVFRTYMSEISSLRGKKVTDFYRDKSVGWRPVHFTFVFEDGSRDTVSGVENLYNRGFAANLFQRPSCYQCEWASVPRVGDITLGDWFGGDKYKLHDPDNKGLSMIVVNTEKGGKLLDAVGSELFLKRYPVEDAVRESEHLAASPRDNPFRSFFFSRFNKQGFTAAARIVLPTKFWPRVRKKIYLYILKCRK